MRSDRAPAYRPYLLSSSRGAGAIVMCTLLALSVGARAEVTPAARPDPAKGKAIAADVCGACHNPDGNSVVSTNPKLAGQNATYLVKQLTEFAKPAEDKSARENAVMSGIATTLSPEDRANVAAWFASQAPWPAGTAVATELPLGQRLYRAGIPEKGVPACAGCHGPAGNGLPVLYPRIGGQHADYVEAQLHAFREGTRHNNVPMWQIAFRLSDPEIKALSQYVAGLRAQ